MIGSLAVAGGAASCANGETTAPDEAGGSSGSGVSQGGATSGGKSGSGTTGGTGGTTGGTGGTTGGTGGSTGGTPMMSGAGGTLSTGGTGAGGSGGMSVGGSSGAGGSTGGTSGAGATGGAGGSAGAGTCTDTPPPNGTCADAVTYSWCGQSWLNGACAKTCGTCTGGGSGGSGGTGGTGGGAGKSGGGAGGTGGTGGTAGTGGTGGGVAPPPDINGGQNAWASRYWDCCKPACGWTGNTGGKTPMKSCDKSNNVIGDNNAKNACESGGSAYMCWSDAPWSVGDQLSYGFAAASGSNYSCGKCFHVQFDGGTHNGGMQSGASALKGKHMIIQVINNGGVAADQFDLLIPGGGVGALNACSTQWGTSDLGSQYGGFLAGCNGDTNCVKNKCMTVFSGKPDLQAGCDWFLGWFNAADNPTFKYEAITCPAAITQKSGLGG